MNPDRPLIAELRAAVHAVLRPLLAGGGPVALLDFPAYSNPGDSAIWLGTRRFLASLGVRRLAYVCDVNTFDPDALLRRVGHGTILLQGGGNLGDLYERHQRFRELVLQTCPRNAVVQLPQSIHFRDPHALDRARAAFDGHGRFVLLVRDQQSFAVAQREFHCQIALCPDLAFCLDRLPRAPLRPDGVTWLLRADLEAAVSSEEASKVRGRDWLDEPVTPLLALDRRLRRLHGRSPVGRAVAATLLRRLQDPVARARLRRGCRVLLSSRSLVTDRLHAHILGMLLGIPHVLLDNSYGKLSSFHRTWTSGSRLARWADSVSAAGALLSAS